ncbi:MAG: glycine cleavage system protein R [Halothiobacillaceae bacterium]
MQTHLAVNLLAKDAIGLVERITRPVAQNKCVLLDSRMFTLDDRFAATMLVGGSWDRLSRLETALRQLASQYEMELTMMRTEPPAAQGAQLPYVVDIVGINDPDIPHVLAQFFAAQGVNIRDLSTIPYQASGQHTAMLSLRMQVDIPADRRLALFKDAFFDLCDEYNLDATLDPVR